MEPGTNVRERITGKSGVVVGGGLTLFPSIRGHLNLDGTYDDGLRDIPHEMLKEYKPEPAAVMEALADVLQA